MNVISIELPGASAGYLHPVVIADLLSRLILADLVDTWDVMHNS